MLQYDMKNKEDRIHPTQKPIALYRWLLENYTNENDLIVDTHIGSGSIAIAAHYMKRKLIGYEIDKEYYDAACKRFKEQTMQQALGI
jgi:site-specific DNA-methyltransferase (adenine-specific)